jgi:hypothetical protein
MINFQFMNTLHPRHNLSLFHQFLYEFRDIVKDFIIPRLPNKPESYANQQKTLHKLNIFLYALEINEQHK